LLAILNRAFVALGACAGGADCILNLGCRGQKDK